MGFPNNFNALAAGAHAASLLDDNFVYGATHNTLWLSGVAGTNDITGNADVTPTGYALGQRFGWVQGGANTGAMTLNANGLGGGAVLNVNGSAVSANQAPAGAAVEAIVVSLAPLQFMLVSSKPLVAITNSLGGDVALNNTANYFTGPTCAQGTVGTWIAFGTVTVLDTGGAAAFIARLTDGVSIAAVGVVNSAGASQSMPVPVSGVFVTPAGNIRINVRDVTANTGQIKFNASGDSKDSTLTVVRIA